MKSQSYVGILIGILAAASMFTTFTYAHNGTSDNCTSEGCRGDFTLLPNQTRYQAGVQSGLDDYNLHVNDTSHHFECPLAKIAPHSSFCRGYDHSLRLMMSDQ